ncbi:hypothetical protein MSAN_00172400 [Mycena sanguinolenta]|uniref:Uncharacterized protein n=1 Tax=Mycena sanguinolenta TaxID=230812 RepID=A0A8H7DM78_9AGAR|nr:hypothetical protein MSAN_00172400 [Mycena sanguinolenta]
MLRACFRKAHPLVVASRSARLNAFGFRACSTHAASYTTTRNDTPDKAYTHTKPRAHTNSKTNLKMGKNNKKKAAPPPESLFHIVHPSSSSSSRAIVDTHTHLASTFEAYRHKYPSGQYTTVYDFVKGLPIWKEFADAALANEQRAEKWGGVEYWFVMGVHPHEARLYDDAVEADILEAMTHPRCVGWGEIGLDYHYDNSPRPVQQAVFARQLKHGVRLGKPLTIHTREADEDTERILKEEVPREHRIHIHCFTDSPAFAQRLLDWFPNLYIGITGVITYTSNTDTSTAVRNMFPSLPSPSTSTSTATSGASEDEDKKLRILLETDAPYMVPAPIYTSAPFVDGEGKGKKLPLCHSGMVPWTAEFVAGLLTPSPSSASASASGSEAATLQEGAEAPSKAAATTQGENGGGAEKEARGGWDAARVMRVARANARAVYGV